MVEIGSSESGERRTDGAYALSLEQDERHHQSGRGKVLQFIRLCIMIFMWKKALEKCPCVMMMKMTIVFMN